MKVIGKQKLCDCNDYKKYFKSIQGRNGFTIFDRYKELENIVRKHIDEKYCHFLAQPEVSGNDIVWFAQPYYEVPKRLSELEEQDRTNYEKIKNDTLTHYQKVVGNLREQNKIAEAEILESAIKFVNNDFVYCYDGKTVLGVWGMGLRDEVREPLGIAMKNAFEKPKKKKSEEESESTSEQKPEQESEIEPEPNPEQKIETELNTEPWPEQAHEKTFKVRFFGGGHGELHGQVEYEKNYGDKVVTGEVPGVVSEDGYRFIGWDKPPINYAVKEDTDFIAQYEAVEEKKSWWTRSLGWGCLNWLLLLPLIVLLGLLLWYLLGQHPHFFCGCDCEQIVNPIPTPTPSPVEPDPNVPPVQPCSDFRSGEQHNTPVTKLFDMGQTSGEFLFEYATGGVYADKIVIYDGKDKSGKVIFTYYDVTGDSGWMSSRSKRLKFTKQYVYIEVTPAPSDETYWEIIVHCPK